MNETYLPSTIRDRLQDLMKERKISQTELAAKIGCTDSTLSRFLTAKTDKLSDENIIRIARAFNVSTDFLLGVTNTPDRKNYEIAELGLSVQATRNLYTGKVNAKVVNRLLESPRFAEVTQLLEQYFSDTFAAGFAAQNQMYNTLINLLRNSSLDKATNQTAKDINRLKTPVYQADLTTIQNQFMATVNEIKKDIGNELAASQMLTHNTVKLMFDELTKGQDIHKAHITPEQIANAITGSVAGMEGASQEDLDKFGQAITEFLQSTIKQANEKK